MSRLQRWWCGAALCAVLLAYANFFHNGFHFDDFHTVVDNPAIRSLRSIPRFFTDAKTFSVLPANQTYRPLVSLSLALDYTLARGYHPFWFHVDTFAVFVFQLVAMFVLFRTILRGVAAADLVFSAALFGTALYGLHPAVAETLNYIIQRGDVFVGCGIVLALALYAARPQLRKTGIYLLPFALAMLSKPTAAAFPLLLAGYILYFEPPRSVAEFVRRMLPAILVCAALLWLQSAKTPHTFAPGTVSPAQYRLTQPYVLLRYFGQFFLPLHLNVDTDLQPFTRLTPATFAGLAFLAAAIALCVATARTPLLRPISFGVFWFLAASLPTSLYRLSEVENDHRMYLPFIGLALAAAWCSALLLRRAAQPSHRTFALTAGCILLAAYGWGTHQRNRVWRTEDSLWLDDIHKSPHNGRGLMIYGLTRMQHGDYPAALALFHRAALYTPNYPTLEINLGIASAATGDPAGADRHFRRALQLAPADDQAHFFYGRWLYQQGQLPTALDQLRLALQLNPARLATRDLLISALAAADRLPEAEALARSTLALAPNDMTARLPPEQLRANACDYWINVSLSLYRQARFAASLSAAQQALQFDPASAIAWNNVGAAAAGLEQWPAAIDAEAHALRLDPSFALARNNLAWAESQLQSNHRRQR